MWRRFSRWAVTLLGLALAGGGAAAIANGWGMIQIERGWSLFIGGAAALAGGAVVLGIGQVLLRLDELVVAAQGGVAERASAPLVARSAARKPESRPIDARPQLQPQTPPPANNSPPPAPKALEQGVDKSTEVDRYTSGDITYVMYSDGAVEVRTPGGSQRYASLAELRAQAAQQY